jgi:hypothetical protein
LSNTKTTPNFNALKERSRNFNPDIPLILAPTPTPVSIVLLPVKEPTWFEKNVQPRLSYAWKTGEKAWEIVENNPVTTVFVLLLLILLSVIARALDMSVWELLLGIGIICFVLLFIFVILLLLGNLIIYFLTQRQTFNAGLIFCLLALIVGGILYFFRCWKRQLYGLSEIIVALILIYFTIYKASGSEPRSFNELLQGDSLSIILALASSIYIIVRGLDNIGRESLEKAGMTLLNKYRSWASKDVSAS